VNHRPELEQVKFEFSLSFSVIARADRTEFAALVYHYSALLRDETKPLEALADWLFHAYCDLNPHLQKCCQRKCTQILERGKGYGPYKDYCSKECRRQG